MDVSKIQSLAAFGLVAAATLAAQKLVRSTSTKSPQSSTDLFEKIVTVSAPGKVLVAGGYLVLEQPNMGVTVGATSRFYTSIRCIPRTFAEVQQQSTSQIKLLVASPQFKTEYTYLYDVVANTLINKSVEANTFVEKCLSLTFSFLKEHLGSSNFQKTIEDMAKCGCLSIKLRADNDFYSQTKELQRQSLPLLSSSLERLKKFTPCPVDASTGKVEVAKTGLGSSAALTTSLIGGLLQWFGVTRLGMRIADEDRRVIHNLSQLVHANAQGKIGSGFDVAAAVYGTQTYQRFSEVSFRHCLEEHVSSADLYKAVMDTTGLWDQKIAAFVVPPGIVMVLGDVCGGSSSSSMAREVLKWKKEKSAEAMPIWTALAETNTHIADTLAKLNNLSCACNVSYSAAIHWASNVTRDEWAGKSTEPVIKQLLDLSAHFSKARRLLKQMGDCADVGIEPNTQTDLADATEQLPGVITALVPGAGGVDALVALTLSAAARERVERLWSTWHASGPDRASVCPLMLKAENGILTGVAAHSDIAWD